MSERLHSKESSSNRSSESLKGSELQKQQERIKNKIEQESKNAENKHRDNLDKIRTSIDKETKNKQEKVNSSIDKDDDSRPILINHELKNIAYKRTIKTTQKKLSAPSRTLSKIVHQDTIEKISEIGEKTIARPSGILFGGIFSFVGSSIFLWAARHYGFEYNFLLFLLFFIGGFFVGLVIELVFRIFKRNKI